MKIWILFNIICLAMAINISDKKNNGNDVPQIILEKNKEYTLPDPYFSHSVGGEKIKERTIVKLKYDDNFLVIEFECLDDPWVEYNQFTKDNSMLSIQEVFELFISNGEKPLEQYLEIQINPNNAIFLGKITYRYKTDKSYNCEKINPETSGVAHSVSKDIAGKKWTGILKLPLEILDYPARVSEDTYRFNLYRIIRNEKPEGKKWGCTSENASFACWNSTLTDVPQFHAPGSFGYLILK